MALIEVKRVACNKEKALVHDRGYNFDSIATKLGTQVGLIRIQIEFVNELCGANRSGNTFLQRKHLILSRIRNFDPIVSKHCTKVCL